MKNNFFVFLCCAMLFDAAFAVTEINPGDNQGAELTGGLSIPSTDYARVMSGIGMSVAAPGISIGSLYIGTNATPSVTPAGQVYVEVATSPTYSIRSDGDVSVNGFIEVGTGRSLGIGALTQGQTIETFSVKEINAYGALSIANVGAFSSQSITSQNNFSLFANTVDVTGSINSTGVNTTINAAEGLSMTGDFVAGGNVTTINAGEMSVTNLQNMTGTMAIVSDGTITTTGNFENNGTSLSVKGTTNEKVGPDLVVGDAVVNVGQEMTLTLNSLKVAGSSGTNASFVNGGDLVMTVSGETNLANGFDLSTMDATNVFNLTTGKLVLGGGADAMSRLFENDKLTNYNLVVNNGGITAGNITNGTSSNSVANMSVKAASVVANSIQNYAEQMNVSSTNNGDIEISATLQGTSIYAKSGSETNVNASGTLSTTGAVTNNGTMDLRGNVVELVGVGNSGTLTIMGPTNTTGNVTLSGGINNSGTATISASQISIGGTVENTAGKTTVTGSDTSGDNMAIGGVNVTGGMLELDAKIGGIDITNSFVATNTGAINIDANVANLNVGGTTTIGGDLTFSDTPVTGGGNVNVAHSGDTGFVLSSTGGIGISGDVVATENTGTRSASLVSNNITVGGNVNVANANSITFGDTNSSSSSLLSITGDVTANNGGFVEIYSKTATLKSLSGNGKYLMHGKTVSATGGTINVSNGIWYDGTTSLDKGMIITGTDELTLQTTAEDKGIDISGGVSIANGKLNIASAADANIFGNVVIDGTNGGALDVKATANDVVFDTGTITTKNGGSVTAAGKTITTSAITNGENDTTGTVTLGGTGTESINVNGAVSNHGSFTATAGTIQTAAFTSTGGTVNITATGGTLKMDAVDVSAGSAILSGSQQITLASLNQKLTGLVKLSSGMVSATGDIVIANGDVSQNGTTGALILNGVSKLGANNLTVSNGALVVSSGDTLYEITNNASFLNGITVGSGAATINAFSITGGPIVNSDELTLNAKSDFSFDTITNTGTLVLNTTGDLGAKSITNDSGTINITANNTKLTNAMTVGGMLYQNYSGTLNSGDVNITPKNHNLKAASLTASGIIQSDVSTMSITTDSTIINGAVNANVLTINSPLVQITGALDAKDMEINVANVTIGGGITADDLRIAALDSNDWLTVNVTGNVSGNVDIVGLKNMTITGDYTYNNNSMLHAAILANPATNYWSTVSLADDNTLGRITNAATNAAPLISVGGQFIYDVSNVGNELFDDNLVNPQIGLDIFDMVDAGTAIWLLHSDSDNGLKEVSDKIRNLNVNFCNADGTRCFSYFNSVLAEPDIADGLPIYLSVRDIDEDGVTDSIYVVFDPRFGGPVRVFQMQPIVDRVVDHTDGEHDAAGALDNMIAGQLQKTGFLNRTPIEAIPVAFRGTNLAQLANEIYNRMEEYVTYRDGAPFARFARLVQPRELELVAGDVALNEHTTFRDFEDRMFDEFIWNRNRSLKKAWVDVDYGWTVQDIADDKRADGTRFSVAGGYDWQQTKSLILGLTARVSHMSSENEDSMDLSYKVGEIVNGHNDFRVSDTDIGIGGYLFKNLGTKMRLYGNAFLDLHLFDITRHQNFVADISGSGTAVSLISEWGLMHDWLNQYIVGNLYARVGYNFGFSVKEKAGGDEYMRLKSDGYMILTPGYSIVAQKRIYPTSWFQIRPYASVGVEYDVLGMPDDVRFKFGPANSYTDYGINIDPLWANIGGGVEMLSANGIQVGLDYRYQYNNDMQLHKIKLSGSYRF